MKRFIFLCLICIFASYSSAYAWWGREHATVAQIAENHLTPKAKALMREYLGGRPMAYYAAHPDHFRHQMQIPVGVEGEDIPDSASFSHAFYVDSEFKPLQGPLNEHGKFTKNSIYDMERLARGLKKDHRTMNDSVRLTHLYCIIHGMGDMHCPMHVEVDANHPTPHGKYRLTFRDGDSKINKSLHGLYEMRIISTHLPWGCGDLATMLDNLTSEQAEQVTQGDLRAWGEESAREAALVYNEFKAGSTVDGKKLHEKCQKMAENSIVKAGYRLAKVLNDILN